VALCGLRSWSPRHVRDPEFPDELAQAGAELLLNVHSLYIVPPAVLQVPRLGAYNLHPGLLPACAGLNAPSWAGLSLALRCAQKGVDLIRKMLEVIASGGSVPQTPQDRAQRRYYGREVPQGGRIDWNAPARRIHDFVRACDYQPFVSPWGVPKAILGSREVEVCKTALTGERCDAPPGTVKDNRVATADEWLELRKFR
jgi:methionyl-tRNA formyltransferase